MSRATMPSEHSRQQPIAVVGLGALMPGATDVAGFWRTVLEGRDLITDVPPHRWLVEDYYDPDPLAPDKTYARRGAFLPEVDFDPMAYGVVPANLPATDTTQLLALLVAEQVLADACGPDRPELDRDRVSVVLGATTLPLLGEVGMRLQRPVWLKALRESGVEEPRAQAICDRIAAHAVPWKEATFPGVLNNVVAGRIASHFDLHGTNHTTDAACASSLAALSVAVAELELGRADLVIAGGVDTANDIGAFMCFSKTPALSPTGDCRPFSDAADGTMLGEGLVMFALKRLADAERDADRVYAVIRGVGTSSDGSGTAIYAPAAAGQARALRRAYREAGYGPDTVELVEAHGTGTRAGDAAEVAALRAVFTEYAPVDGGPWCALGSIKSQVGHTKSTAGAAGLLKAVLALHHRVLPPTIKVARPDPQLDLEHSPFYLNTAARPWARPAGHPRRASVSSFGFGGTNFHVTVEEYVPGEGWGRRAGRSRCAPTELVLLSAGSPGELLDAVRRPADRSLAAIARDSQERFDAAAPVRLAVVASDLDDLAGRLARASAQIEQPAVGPSFAAPGICYAAGPAAPGTVGLLFPGQGAQYPGMGADLAMHLPAAQAVWDRLGGLVFGGRALHRVMVPAPAFTDEDRAAQRALLTATEWAQPALAVHSLALLAVLRSLGVAPGSVAGHSFGELVALHAAGVFDADALVRLARRRGEVTRDAAAATPGAMLAVAAPRERVEEALAGTPEVWLANHNAPDQVVLSATPAAVAAAEAALATRGVRTRRLAASAAFHSPLVAAASDPLRAALAAVDLAPPEMTVYGNADGRPYPIEPERVRQRVGAHLASPVLFTDTVEAMYAAGVRTFVEVGPGATLTGLVGRILGDREHLAVALDRPGQHGVTALHEALGRLAVHGIPLDLAALWEECPPPVDTVDRGPRMIVKIDGGNYGRPYPPPDGASVPPASAPAPAGSAPPASAPAPTGSAPVVPVPAPVFAPAGPDRQGSTVDEALLRVVEESNRQNAEALSACQQALTEAYLAYLASSESTVAALLGLPATRAPAPTDPRTDPMIKASFRSSERDAVRVEAPRTASIKENHADQGLGHSDPRSNHVPEPLIGGQDLDPGGVLGKVSAMTDAEFQAYLLSVVADSTGYPVGLLNVDMELEKDLGIDSIKKIEILSAMNDQLRDLSRDELAELATLRTLRQVGAKVRERLGGPSAPDPAAAPAVAAGPAPVTAPDPAAAAAVPDEPGGVSGTPAGLDRYVLRAVAAEPDGVPVPGLGNGVLAVTDDGGGVARAVVERLARHGVRAGVVTDVPPDAAGVLLLDGLADVASPEAAMAVQRRAFQAARAVAARFAAAGGVFVTVQDTGGELGLAGVPAGRGWLGGLAALARTAAREWPRASVKAIDCAQAGRSAGAVADAITGELLTGGSTLDVGLRADGSRCTPRAVAAPLPAAPGSSVHIGPDSVVVATGGARGITAASLVALGRAHRPRLVLLGRTPLDPEPAGLAPAADEAALVRELAREAEPDAPAALAARARQILAAREVRATLSELEQAGATARYLAVDVRDPAALSAALDGVRAEWGPVTALVHGAGVLADTLLADKSDDQFDRVFATKVGGLRALLAATAADPVATICLYSSVAGRFGNAGQSDYAMANEVLNLVAAELRASRPGCLVRSIAWGPWQGGMVTPALARQLDRAGVPVVPVALGAQAFLAELAGAGSGAEPGGGDTCVVIAGRGGVERLATAAAGSAGGHPGPVEDPAPVDGGRSSVAALAGDGRVGRAR
ncbi:SDR family NAD(P)-dependent oxidoreductase [Actinomycetes bacterium KLBMP 9797]